MLRFLRRQRSNPSGAPDCRAYVIGDVHGRLDLLEDLLATIHAEIQHRPAEQILLVFVGDLIDRGPRSANVLERLRTYHREGIEPVFILGNHEEVLLRILAGEALLIADWLCFGGAECLQSYGVDPAEIALLDEDEALARVRNAIPKNHVEFLENFTSSLRFGDYLFVHAGVRPGVPLDRQSEFDLRWIREPFLSDSTDHGFMVIHGHTISKGVEERPNRIGIDTGAYRSGVLTALAIEGESRWLLDTRGPSASARD
jgi:serine/threonine protein phosphatase 1